MRRPLRLALRTMSIGAASVLLASVFSSSRTDLPSPYVPALAGIVAGELYAAPSSCGNSGCNSYGHCTKVRGSNCRYAGGECSQTAC